jgi:hypothetical protein
VCAGPAPAPAGDPIITEPVPRLSCSVCQRCCCYVLC